MARTFGTAAPKLRLVHGGRPSAHEPGRPPRPSLDDAEILAALRDGDESVGAAFHDRVRPQVERTIHRLLGPGDVDHDDVAQLALIELVNSVRRYRGDCSLDAWTSTVTAHVIYKHIRRRRLERRIFVGATVDDLAPMGGTNVGRSVELAGALSRVRALLEEMDPDKSWTFLLHDVLGYDLREIAEIMNVTVAAAQRRLVRGRNELHVRIEADPELAGSLDDLEILQGGQGGAES